MPAGTLISVEEYLNTSYDPDVEYVDGVLVERNGGKWRHSLVQRNLILGLARRYPDLLAVPELRIRTGEGRYRVPDVCVVAAPPQTAVLFAPPPLVVEILSETDTVSEMMEKLKEYAEWGATNIWVFDPRLRQMFTYEKDVLRVVDGGRIATADHAIELTSEDAFRGLE